MTGSRAEGQDKTIAGMVPRTGETREGLPLSLNRAPAADLVPWVARMVVAKIEAPRNLEIRCGLLNDIGFIRIPLGGPWTADTLEGAYSSGRQALLFGPQSKLMRVSCSGQLYSAGFGLKPGALHALTGLHCGDFLDRILPSDRVGLGQELFADLFAPEMTPEELLLGFEEALRHHIAATGAEPPDPVSAAFELAAFDDPNLSVADFATEYEVGIRKLERIIKRDFGMTPKQVLRRARALDLASQLCGVADQNEEADLMLRYSDQSHLIREFASFFETTPKQFVAHPKPLLTLNLETRQARRLEELKRLVPGAPRPWSKR